MKKILIIKLGAKGDVVRTLPILQAIKEKYPNSQIHWIVKKSNLGVVENNPKIDKIYTLENPPDEIFDILYNFDIEEEATSLAMKIPSAKKYGFYSEGGYASSFNLPSEYYLNTLFDDETKINNRKTCQQMMFDVAELSYNKQHDTIYLQENDKKYVQDFIQINNLNTEKLIGIHMGAGSRWPSKEWDPEKVKQFIKLATSKGYEILLFGGPNEILSHKKLSEELQQENIKFYRSNPHNTDKEFASLVDICKIMICSDSFALHIALAMKKPTLGLFFCTPYYEIETYNLFKPIASPKLYDFFPEKMDQYDKELVNSISAEQVLEEVERVITLGNL